MNKINKTNNYKTSSLPLATFLSIQQPIIDIDRESPTRALFVFDQTTELESLITDYWAGNTLVEPQAYFNQLKIVKARLYDNA